MVVFTVRFISDSSIAKVDYLCRPLVNMVNRCELGLDDNSIKIHVDCWLLCIRSFCEETCCCRLSHTRCTLSLTKTCRTRGELRLPGPATKHWRKNLFYTTSTTMHDCAMTFDYLNRLFKKIIIIKSISDGQC